MPISNTTHYATFTTRAASHAVASPCVSVCKIDETIKLCTGCWRTLDEIALWSSASNAEKLQIWRALGERRRAAEPALQVPPIESGDRLP